MKHSNIGRPRFVTDEHITEILEWHREKKELGTLEQLARRLGYSKSVVCNVIRRKGVYKVGPPRKETA